MKTETNHIEKIMEKVYSLQKTVKTKRDKDSIEFLIFRLANSLSCYNTGKDMSGSTCEPFLIGTYLLKTWRMAREPGYLICGSDQTGKIYLEICDNLLEASKLFLGQDYDVFYRLEQCSYRLSTQLMKFSSCLTSLSSNGIKPEYKEEILNYSLELDGLAYSIYNGHNKEGKLICCREGSNKALNMARFLATLDWKEKTAGGEDAVIATVLKSCKDIGNILSSHFKTDSTTNGEKSSSPSIPRELKEHEKAALDNMGMILEKMMSGESSEKVFQSKESPEEIANENDAQRKTPDKIREEMAKKIKETEKKEEKTVDEDDEAFIEALRATFFLSEIKEDSKSEQKPVDAKVRKQVKQEDSVRKKISSIFVLIYILLLVFAVIIARKETMKQLFTGKNTYNSVINRKRMVLVGTVKFGDNLVSPSYRDNSYYYPGLLLICYFPERKYQIEIKGDSIPVNQEGEFRIELDVPVGVKPDTITKIKVAMEHKGYSISQSKNLTLKGDPPTAYLPDTIMEAKNEEVIRNQKKEPEMD